MSVNTKKYFNYLYFFLTFSITTFVLILTLRVKRVECHQSDSDSQDLVSVCQELKTDFLGKSLIFYNFAEADVWQKLAQSADYQELYQLSFLEKQAPNTLILHLDSKLPDYRLIIINDSQQEQSYILNQNNHLKKDQGQVALFEILYQGRAEILSKNKHYLEENYHQFFLSLKNNLDHYQIEAKRLLWQADDLLELDLGKSWLVILDQDINPEQTIQNLSLILLDKEVLTEIEKQGFLDMRFNLPVIREQI
jgi:hypothetical protein